LRFVLGAAFWMALGASGTLVYTGQLGLEDLRDHLPDGDDLRRVEDVAPEAGPREPARVIYLHRGPLALTGGADASHHNRSSVVFSSGLKDVAMPGFSGPDRTWREVVRCVRTQFAPFAVEVTDVRPEKPGYALVAIGGSPNDLKVDNQRITGLAPFSGGVVPDPVVFAFSKAMRNRVRAICETVAMEVAHAYGLDHTRHCPDVMSYGGDCGAKTFVDRDAACGERADRVCASGQPIQNSFKMMEAVLGLREKMATRAAEAPPAQPFHHH
jgi:hypothetical protein